MQADVKEGQAIVAIATDGWDAVTLRRVQLNEQDMGLIL
jgi:hypothetical protein